MISEKQVHGERKTKAGARDLRERGNLKERESVKIEVG